MHPLTIASNNLVDDGVSSAGLGQKTDLITKETTKSRLTSKLTREYSYRSAKKKKT